MSRVIEENGRRSAEKELWSDKKYLDFQFHLQNIHLQIRDLLLKADF